MSQPATPDKHTFPCGQCGANLTFAPGTEALECEYCGHRQKVEPIADKATIQEHDFREALSKAPRKQAADLVQQGKEVECNGCGAHTVIEGLASACPYCDAPVVAVTVQGEGVLVPESLLAFKVSRQEGLEAFRAWVKSLWFAPGDLAKRALEDKLNGVYVPYWTYDSRTETSYVGERGDHYWDTETYTDAEGKQQTRQVQRTRWSHASGTVRVPFDDVLICASKGLPGRLVVGLEPWDLPELTPYGPAYLSGFMAERYSIDLEQGFHLAEGRMLPTIRGAICRDIGGDEQRIHSLSVTHHDVTFKHLLLPIWISSFRYAEKVYRFLVNARSGAVSGERPWSVIKIVLFTLFIVALVVGGVLLAQALKAR